MAPSNNSNNNGSNFDPGDPYGGPSIPLDDLPRGAGASGGGGDDGRGGRGGHTGGQWNGRGASFGGGRYERVANDSPSRREPAHDGFDTVDLSDRARRQARVEDDDDYVIGSELAHSTVGLSFDPDAARQSPYRLEPGFRSSSNSEDLGSFSNLGQNASSGEFDQYSSPPGVAENDTTPLTDRRYLQPISGAEEDTRGVRFADGPTPRVSRLGDDLPHLEEGRDGGQSDGARSRLSSSAAISKAGSMMRMISQRVVNLSNEPELEEQSARPKASRRQSRMDGPPSLPAMAEYAHDMSTGQVDVDGIEDMPSFWSKNPPAQTNPLKGKSLGIFSPENKVRKGLCEILIHPAAETIVLVLIVLHTILLCVESKFDKHLKGFQWGTPAFDYAFLVLFGFYTVELTAKIIVSGFIFNPTEYSTLDRSQGLRKALVSKGENLFMPYRKKSTKKKPPKPIQSSILRTFTGFARQDETKDKAQEYRIRLARRAFLRHSFNRLDFLAVVAYWISVSLAASNIESTKHLYIFRMLSCLRILRLMALTEGTTVGAINLFFFQSLVILTCLLAYSQRLEKGCASSCQRCFLHLFLLALICYYRSAELQIQLTTDLCLDRS